MTLTYRATDVPITTWKQFTQVVRIGTGNLLKRLDEFPNSILVTGCQRSGTTMLSRIITQSAGMTNYWFGKDDELDAALILSGQVDHIPNGRYCFQTTYLDEYYREYFEHQGPFKMIWVIRNPYSVVYSLLYNWSPGSVEGTFKRLVATQLSGHEKTLYSLMGSLWISPVRQASLIYRTKFQQFMEILDTLGREKVFIVDYDDIVSNKDFVLKQIYQFVELEYDPNYGNLIHTNSIDKKSKLTENERQVIKRDAEPSYQKAKSLLSTDRQPLAVRST